MGDYRAYRIGPDGHFADVEIINATDDSDAVRQAFAGEQHPRELWQRDRLVAVLERDLTIRSFVQPTGSTVQTASPTFRALA